MLKLKYFYSVNTVLEIFEGGWIETWDGNIYIRTTANTKLKIPYLKGSSLSSYQGIVYKRIKDVFHEEYSVLGTKHIHIVIPPEEYFGEDGYDYRYFDNTLIGFQLQPNGIIRNCSTHKTISDGGDTISIYNGLLYVINWYQACIYIYRITDFQFIYKFPIDVIFNRKDVHIIHLNKNKFVIYDNFQIIIIENYSVKVHLTNSDRYIFDNHHVYDSSYLNYW